MSVMRRRAMMQMYTPVEYVDLDGVMIPIPNVQNLRYTDIVKMKLKTTGYPAFRWWIPNSDLQCAIVGSFIRWFGTQGYQGIISIDSPVDLVISESTATERVTGLTLDLHSVQTDAEANMTGLNANGTSGYGNHSAWYSMSVERDGQTLVDLIPVLDFEKKSVHVRPSIKIVFLCGWVWNYHSWTDRWRLIAMRYAKLNSGAIEYASRTITVGRTHYNPTPESWLTERGYLPVVETAYPDDGKYYVGSWQEQDGQIIRVWTETEAPKMEGVMPV